MEARIFCLVLALQVVSFVSVTSRPFAANDAGGVNQPVTGQSPESSLHVLLGSNQGIKSMKGVEKEEAYSKGLSKMGSSPPSCENKCYGCTPCEAIQVPTTSKKHNHNLGLNYANYEPEGWKCKCGPSLYSP